MTGLKALLWDVDGTLAETERDGHRVAFNMAFEVLGLPRRWEVRHYGELLLVSGGFERLLHDMRHWPDAPGDQAGREALARHLHGLKNQLYGELLAAQRLQARPGVVAMLEAAEAAGVRQAVVTTTSRINLEGLLARVPGLERPGRWELQVCGEDVARKKPDPQAYLLALDRLGLKPGEACAIEDSPAGAAASAASGLPLCLRPSGYFPEVGLPCGALGWLCSADSEFNWPALREWHRALTGPARGN